MEKIVILGGGYGGQSAAKQLLERGIPDDTRIELIDRLPYQGLKTEYYALASGSIADVDIRVHYPEDPRLSITYGEIVSIHLENQQVWLQDTDPISYDILIIALGCTDKFHGIPGAEEFTYGVQSLSATRKTYQAINDIKPYGQLSIVGGGLSGVEIASELRECRSDLNIRIMDRGDSILSAFPIRLQKYVTSWFLEHDIEINPNVSISKVEPHILWNQNEQISTDITVWTAGIQPSAIVQNLDLTKDPQGRIIINEYHQVPVHPEVYIVGDCASLPFAPSAQLAEAQGKQVAEVIQALSKGQSPQLGQMKLKGVLGSLGKKAGFGLMGKKTVMKGRVPRLLKSGILWMSKRHFG